MSPINRHETPPARWSWLFGTALVLWTTFASLATYSYAGASPTNAAKVAAMGASTASAAEGLTGAYQLSDAFADIAERVSPSVVTIKVETNTTTLNSPSTIRLRALLQLKTSQVSKTCEVCLRKLTCG